MTWPRHWNNVSKRLQDDGYNRSIDECAAYWVFVQDKSPLAGRSGLDSEAGSVDSSIGTDRETDNKPKFLQDEEEISSHSEQVLPARSATLRTSPPRSRTLESEILVSGSRQIQEEKQANTTSQDSVQSPHIESSQKPKSRVFHFQPAQRGVLEAEAAVNGCYPDLQKREELANQLGVGEKTIRNWFVNHRKVSGGSQDSSRRHAQSPTSNSSLSTEEYAPLDSANKRGRDSVDVAAADDWTEESVPEPKKPRFNDGSTAEKSDRSKGEANGNQHNTINPLTSNVIDGCNELQPDDLVGVRGAWGLNIRTI